MCTPQPPDAEQPQPKRCILKAMGLRRCIASLVTVILLVWTLNASACGVRCDLKHGAASCHTGAMTMTAAASGLSASPRLANLENSAREAANETVCAEADCSHCGNGGCVEHPQLARTNSTSILHGQSTSQPAPLVETAANNAPMVCANRGSTWVHHPGVFSPPQFAAARSINNLRV